MKDNLSMELTARTNYNIRTGSFPCIHLLNKISGYAANKFLPATASASFSPVIPIKKVYGNEKGLTSFFNILLKQVAARLSDIEMDLNCYKISHLHFSAHVIRDLFLAMDMQEAYRYAGQMEEMAKENKMQEVKDLLLAVKKIIAQAVQYNQQQND